MISNDLYDQETLLQEYKDILKHIDDNGLFVIMFNMIFDNIHFICGLLYIYNLKKDKLIIEFNHVVGNLLNYTLDKFPYLLIDKKFHNVIVEYLSTFVKLCNLFLIDNAYNTLLIKDFNYYLNYLTLLTRHS